MRANLDVKTVEGFGEEWGRFDQSSLNAQELADQFDRYFAVFPWASLPRDAVGFDLGCGSGRWAKIAADRVGKLHCIDASPVALAVAQKNLSGKTNVIFHEASVDEMPLADDSMDFGYSLGVLHHVPDTSRGIRACVSKLKPGAPFLLYLYYAFDNRPAWFRILWKVSDRFRRAIAGLPFAVKKVVTDTIAATVYFPSARLASACEKLGVPVEHLPLSVYRRHSFYTMRTDALDRFGTMVEHRYTQNEIRRMMEDAGLRDITFSTDDPYWCAVGFRK
jgi:ubiquinone/menaquinone biosynthesis C-methylase UbiE